MENLLNYKMSCLLRQGVVFENTDIRVSFSIETDRTAHYYHGELSLLFEGKYEGSFGGRVVLNECKEIAALLTIRYLNRAG